MSKVVKVITGILFIAGLAGCGHQQRHDQAPPGYVLKLPPAPAQSRRVIVRTETHRVLTPQVIYEPCCRMQPDVIHYRRVHR